MADRSFRRLLIKFPGCLVWPVLVVAALIIYEDLAPDLGRSETLARKDLEKAVADFRFGRLSESEDALAEAIRRIEGFEKDDRTSYGKGPLELAAEIRGTYETNVREEPGLFELFERLAVAELQLLLPERGLVHGAAAESLPPQASAGTVTVEGSVSFALYTGGNKAFRRPNFLDLSLTLKPSGLTPRFEGRKAFSASKEMDAFAFDLDALGWTEEFVIKTDFEELAKAIRSQIRQAAKPPAASR